ncbi:hypothetical protein COCC4DRAFT_193735 [Bipolaris maydis ATCC 48331]|uniref:FHA domain-containing protein n=2 Tax=Cochliobolus heterostrophus TaxID=5016 RepID=M2SM66_COCH5|nr:uncharacterized protein COCC4DRAFT_193735 [Bipolaris maydis ATCC 48331]EMD86410.1 hypothetical protein COCHEDRAFT_1186561 [Bipolaris maydis C5]ENI06360.1 hypothetical protein COCC4DRAFT_193735 [Bipolaris maydis ATCC 48331]
MQASRLTDLPVFRVVLRDVMRYDTYETRQFDLPLNATFAIGRASSSVTKKELMAAPHNAYIDSPVISRQHAVLSANSTTGVPEVYISDQGSMHGTMINGQKLTPNTPTKLSYGDELQFGTDVNRNEEFFPARRYVFEAQLIRPFSLGFTVPDAESEDEEVEVEPLPRCGSHIDRLLAENDSEEAQDQGDATIVMEDMLLQGQPAKTSRFGPDVYNKSILRTTIVEDLCDEDKEGENIHQAGYASNGDESVLPHTRSFASAKDDGEPIESDVDSKSESIDSSEIDSESEGEMNEAEYSEPVANSVTHGTQYANRDTISASEQSANTNLNDAPFRRIYTFRGAEEAPLRLPCLETFGLQRSDYHENTCGESSKAGMAKAAKIDHPPSCCETAPPLPPRSASKPASWGTWSYPPCSQDETQDWYQPANHVGMTCEHPSLVYNSVQTLAQEPVDARSFYPQASEPSQAHRLQTPPPAPVSEAEVLTPLQPGRRTKVSIEEIVEEVVEEIVEEHPPTPISVNDMKRKADVLDEEPAVLQEDIPKTVSVATDGSASNSMDSDPVAEVIAAQTAAQIAQRPKKIPRSVLGKVLNKAAYPLLGATGAVVSFALLSTLPDTFFL